MDEAPPTGSTRDPRESAPHHDAGSASWPPPSKPVLYVNDSPESDEAKALLERHGIDFEVRRTDDPLITLRWKHYTYTDIFGIADFIMFAGRLLPDLRKREPGERAIPGTRVPLS